MTLQATTTTDTEEQFSTMQAPVWPSANSPTTTTDTEEQFYIARGDVPGETDVILLRSERGTGEAAVKWYWRLSKAMYHPVMRHLLHFIAPEEQLGLPGDTGASTTLGSEPWQRPEPDAKVWRGVFSPPYRRETLFSQRVECRTADLPKWKPHISIDRRTLARAEDG
jgi:hypothetical protein